MSAEDTEPEQARTRRDATSDLSLERLFAKHRPALLRMALLTTRNRADAEDLVQAAFVRALESSASFAGEMNWGAWLSTVVHRLAIDRARQNRRRKFAISAVLDELEAPASEPPPPWSDVTSEQLERAVSNCQQSFRQLCDMRYLERLSYAEIARRLDIPVGTVATRLRRARVEIVATLKATGTSPAPRDSGHCA